MDYSSSTMLNTVNESKRNGIIDFGKLVFAVLIVSLHIGETTSAAFGAVHCIARLGVPFFFATAALYLETEESFVRSIKHLARLFLIWNIVYFPISLLSLEREGVLTLIQKIIFKCPYYLWYIAASLIGIVLLYLFKDRLRMGLVISIVLYICGTLLNTYSTLFSFGGGVLFNLSNHEKWPFLWFPNNVFNILFKKA